MEYRTKTRPKSWKKQEREGEKEGGREEGREQRKKMSGNDKGYFENKSSAPVAFKLFCTVEWPWSNFWWNGHGRPWSKTWLGGLDLSKQGERGKT